MVGAPLAVEVSVVGNMAPVVPRVVLAATEMAWRGACLNSPSSTLHYQLHVALPRTAV